MPQPETEGRLLFTFLAPALVAGLIARERCWSWAWVATVYVITATAVVLISALPELKKMTF
jgi:hypothetical protein